MVGSLAMKKPEHGQTLSGVVVKRNFAYHIMSPADTACKYISALLVCGFAVNVHFVQNIH